MSHVPGKCNQIMGCIWPLPSWLVQRLKDSWILSINNIDLFCP